jgi:hypothetical protein
MEDTVVGCKDDGTPIHKTVGTIESFKFSEDNDGPHFHFTLKEKPGMIFRATPEQAIAMGLVRPRE